MRIAYLDCFAGISGDMFLAALLDAGVDPQILHDATAALNLGASLKIEKVDRSGISATRIQVFDGTHPAEEASQSPDHVAPAENHTHPHEHPHEHEHEHKHSHGRHLSAVRKIIQAANLPLEVQQTAIRTFELLGASEARIHNVDIEKIHFHEVGAFDAIVDITAACAGIHALKIDRWYSSPLNVGGGTIDCAHGHFPVPAPATADLLRGLPTYSAHVVEELITPTGAALIRILSPTFGPQPSMRVHQIGYGAGTRNPQKFPNVLRLNIGESDASANDTVTVLETAIDDLSPQILAHVTEQAMAQGALDVMSTAVQMKKGRLGTLITILADDAQAPALERLLFRETSTLGIRIRRDRRSCLDRTHTTVPTPYGGIRVKVGSLNGEEFNAAPEFEDCRAAAAQHNVPVKQVIQSATAAYLTSKAK
ncbi:MAG: nickel pincer cofactor biosynthesis protein LarC [Edaphobacter sp.]